MSVPALYQESVPVLTSFLTNLQAILQKAQQHVSEHKLDEAALLQARLFPDMFPFVRQVQIACDAAKGGVARLAGVEIPKFPDVETSFAELISRVEQTRAFVASVPVQAFESSAERQIVLQFGDWRREFNGAEFLRTWSLPNFYFHITTAYGLLRHNGVALGKMDYLG
jgi:hypothetical protein